MSSPLNDAKVRDKLLQTFSINININILFNYLANNFVFSILCLQVECIIQETLNEDGSPQECGPQLAGLIRSKHYESVFCLLQIK